MDLIKQIVERAKANKQRIVLPEGTEERTLKAADRLLADEVVEVILKAVIFFHNALLRFRYAYYNTFFLQCQYTVG